jgi:uncharacterized membrane protein
MFLSAGTEAGTIEEGMLSKACFEKTEIRLEIFLITSGGIFFTVSFFAVYCGYAMLHKNNRATIINDTIQLLYFSGFLHIRFLEDC